MRTLALDLWAGKGESKVTLRIADIHKRLMCDVPPVFQDLLEIATYVYCADQALTRGGIDVDTLGARWRRLLKFHIPVRCPDVWQSSDVQRVLVDTLEFLSDDVFEFSFYPATTTPPFQQYLGLTEDGSPLSSPAQVVMYSGGLDSLAGAVQECVVEKKRIVLVNHRPTSKLNRRLGNLEKLLAAKAAPMSPVHLNVRINKSRRLNREYTQRTRSFLYVCLGATVARMLNLFSVRFYENGVVSMNLPTCPQVIGARATRTTHPRILRGFQELLTLIAERPFTVENKFIWETKSEIIQRILRADCGPLIGPSTSCAHTWTSTKKHAHCGACSQCIDRRIGIIAANAEEFDSPTQYRVDLFTESLLQHEDKTMLATYVERASRVRHIGDVADLITEFPEIARFLRHLGSDTAGSAERVLALYKRHAQEVRTAIKTMLARHTDDIIDRSLPTDCLLRIVYETGSAVSVPAVPDPVRAPADSAPRFRLRQFHGNWELSFDGDQASIGHEKGLLLVEYLLKNPPSEPIHACDIEAAIQKVGQDSNGMPEITDPETGKIVTLDRAARLQERNLSVDNRESDRRLWKLRKQYMAVEDDEMAGEFEKTEAREQVTAIDEHLKNIVLRQTSNAAKSYDRIRQSINRLLKHLNEFQDSQGNGNGVYHAFAQHLQDYLVTPSARYSGKRSSRSRAKVAQTFTYEPPSGVEWLD